MQLAPIVLFVFDRPDLTSQTLESLSKNELSKDSILYIFADGAKIDSNEDRLNRIKEVHKIISNIDFCKETFIEFSDDNRGLKKSILDGVSKVVNQYGKVIVLEDDLILSPFFLKYMNKSLELYQDSESVYCINGHNFGNGEGFPETFFHQVPHSWGWATWKNKWSKLRLDTENLYNEIRKRKNEFNLSSSYDFFRQLKANYDGTLNTWAIYWYSTIFLNNGLCLTPSKTLVQNIGFGENATNTKYSGKKLVESNELSQDIVLKKQTEIFDNKSINLIIKYYKINQDSLFMNLVKFVYFDILFYFRKKNK